MTSSIGGVGNDVSVWRERQRRINGSAGDDIYVGGGNDDVFVFQPGDGADTIVDFVAGGSGRSRLVHGY